MPAKWVSLLAADDSGRFAKPLPGSNVLPQHRANHFLNDGVFKAFTGAGFNPTVQTFRETLTQQVQELHGYEDWVEIPDLRKFMHSTVGLSTIQAIFGPTLLQVNPTLMDDLFEFEKALPWFTMCLPSFFKPWAYAIRGRLLQQFKDWYEFADRYFKEVNMTDESSMDSLWRSNWMRERQKALAQIKDKDTLASADLGAAWA
jgi:hypothetical protein